MYRKIVWLLFVGSVAMFIAWLAACADDQPTDPKFNVKDTTVVN